ADQSRQANQTHQLYAMLVYKVAGLFCGTAFAYMGYRLFEAGVFGKAGELEGASGNNHLLLKQAAPGTFFALFGCAIVIAVLWRGLSMKVTEGRHGKDWWQSSQTVTLRAPDPVAVRDEGELL